MFCATSVPKSYPQLLRMDPIGFCSVPVDKREAKTR